MSFAYTSNVKANSGSLGNLPFKVEPGTSPIFLGIICDLPHLAQESTNNLLQNVTCYVIPEACSNIAYSIVSAKRDAFRDASSICKTRVTSVTVMGDP